MNYFKLKRNSCSLLFFLAVTFLLKAQEKQQLIIQTLPEKLEEHIKMPLAYAGEQLTLELTKNKVFGANTRFLVDDGTGNLIEIDKGQECTYLGSVTGHPNYTVTAAMTDQGMIASIYRPGTSTIEIRPSEKISGNHEIYVTAASKSTTHKNCHLENTGTEQLAIPSDDSGFENTQEYLPADLEKNEFELLSNVAAKKKAASRRPTTVMEVVEFEIGVEIGSRAFFASTAYNGNLATARASAQSIIGNLNRRFLRGAGVKHTLGTVIIRNNVNNDPLRNSVTGTGASSTAGASLNAFRNYWNNNPGVVGNTHDLAVYHVLGSPSGLAYVNSVGSSNRYATMGGNGATSWANGTAAHEVGHSWSLAHNNVSGIFYENRPRNNSGASTAGGRNFFISIMNGSGNHNISRLSTTEAQRVIAARKAKRSAGTVNNNPGPIPPFGVFDRVTIPSSTSAGTFDVIANDYDGNNDILDVRLLDQVSNKGGRISISAGTGPGGRNRITYTPPASGLSGEDFFHYTVFDRSGRTDFGAVYVKALVSNNVKVNLNATVYNYDLGTPNSPVLNGWTRISERTTGDISWSGGVQSRDRGTATGVNNINRDFIQSPNKRALRHRIKNGVWSIVMNLGDPNFLHDQMTVKAEGRVIGRNVTSQKNAYPYVRADEVTVTDGQLNIELSDNGGSDINWVWNRLTLTRVRNLGQKATLSNLEDVQLYPNPVTDVLNISASENSLEKRSVQIYNNLGSRLRTVQLSGENTALDVSELASGMYYLRVLGEDQGIIKNIPFVKM